MPLTNGSGNEPTTAGIVWVATCPRRALGRQDAIDVVEPVGVRAARPQAVDRLDEPTPVAGSDPEGPLQHAHHGLRSGDMRLVDRGDLVAAEAPGDGERDAARPP